ncbi:MAG: alpha/beta hydrolase [Chloroflexota bacterium]
MEKNSPSGYSLAFPAFRRTGELARTGIDFTLALLWWGTLGADLLRLQSPLVCQGTELALWAVYTLVCVALGLDLCWQLWGRERLSFGVGQAALCHEIGRLRLVQHVPLNEIVGITCQAQTAQKPAASRKVLRFFDFSLGSITITTPERVYRLGAGLKQADAERHGRNLLVWCAAGRCQADCAGKQARKDAPGAAARLRYAFNLFLFANLALSLALIALTPFLSWVYLHPAAYPLVDLNAGDAPSDYGIAYRDVTLTTSDGITLSAWYTPSQNGAVLVLAQGYQETRLTELHARFAGHGYGVVSFDYRARGQSGGQLCTLGYHEALDVIAALEFARSQPGVRHVGAWGYSMGAATVIRAAALHPGLEAIAVDSAFATLEDLLNTEIVIPFMRPWFRLAMEWQTGLRMDMGRPIDQIGAISPRPVFIMGGGSDWTVLPDTAQRLYDAAGEPRKLWLEPAAGHNGACHTNLDRCEQKMINFFDSALR